MRAFLDTGKGALVGGALQMGAVLALIVGLALAAPQGAAGRLLGLLFVAGAATACAVVFRVLASSYSPMRTGAWWLGQLGVLILFAFAAGSWTSPALAQTASASPGAQIPPPSETTALMSSEQTMQSITGGQSAAAGGAGEGADGPSALSQKGIDLGAVQIGDDCVRAGSVTIGDCKENGSGGPGGTAGGGQRPNGGSGSDPEASPETTNPETAPPKPADPQPDTTRSPSQEGPADNPNPKPDKAPQEQPEREPGTTGSCADEGPKEETLDATIDRVVDGDTAELAEPIKGTTTVRFIGVDTPETVDPEESPEPFGKEASTFTERNLEGEEVALELDRDAKDDYDRLLAYVWTDEGLFNEAILAGGYGELLVIEPNDAYEACLAAAEEEARNEGAGLWALTDGGATDPEPPSQPEPQPEQPEAPSEEPQEEPQDEPPASPEPTTSASPEPPYEAPISSPEPAAEPQAEPSQQPDANPAAGGVFEAVPEPQVSSPEPSAPELAFGAPQPAPSPAPEIPEEASTPPLETPEAPPIEPGVTEDQYASSPPATLSSPEPDIVLPDSGGADVPPEILSAETLAADTSLARGLVFWSSLALVLIGGVLLGAGGLPPLRRILRTGPSDAPAPRRSPGPTTGNTRD